MTQEYLRERLLEAIAEQLDELGMPDLGDVVMEGYKSLSKDSTSRGSAIDKASFEAYNSLAESLKKVSRLAVRLGHIERNN
jgi:hypothetical protein